MKKPLSVLCVSLFLASPAISQETLTVGRLHHGELTASDVDPNLRMPVDCYTISLRAGTNYAIDVQGETTLNPKLIVIPGDDTAAPDCKSFSDGVEGQGGQKISFLTFHAETPIKVAVAIFSIGLRNIETGRYSLRLTSNDDRSVRIAPGSYYYGELIADDRQTSEGALFDCYQFAATQGELARFTLEMLGPTLTIFSDDACKGSVLARSVDAEVYLNVQGLRHTMPRTGTYSLSVRSHMSSRDSRYTLRMFGG